jgi:hypothetical protein
VFQEPFIVEVFDIEDFEVVEVVGSGDEVQYSMLVDSLDVIGLDTDIFVSSEILKPAATYKPTP